MPYQNPFQMDTNHKVEIQSKSFSAIVADEWLHDRSAVVFQVFFQADFLAERFVALIALEFEFGVGFKVSIQYAL